jgi:hypothetical protein
LAAQFVEGAFDAHAGGVFAEAEDFADFAEILILEKAQEDGVALVLVEAAHRFIEQGA